MKLPIPAEIFEWPSRHNVHIALPLLLIASFFIHSLCILVFQVAYPRSRSVPPREAQVYFLRPGSSEAGMIEPLLAASDPALFSPAQISNRQSWTLPETAYQASFDSQKPSLDALPSTTPASAVETLLSILPQAPRASPENSSTQGLPTQVQLGGPLAQRAITPPEGIAFTALPKFAIEPAEFLLQVSPEGQVMHVFLQSSSGNEALDAAARTYLLRSRLEPLSREGEASWGSARFLWGSDVQPGKGS